LRAGGGGAAAGTATTPAAAAAGAGPLAGAPRAPLGGRFSVAWGDWDAMQARVDCVARRGAWTEQAEAQLIVPDSSSPDAAGKSCGRGPWTRESDPAFWYNWSGHGRACGAPVAPFSAAAFCAALGDRDLLVVGDSMSFAFHDVVLGALDFKQAAGHGGDGGGGGFGEVHHDQWDTCPAHEICGRATLRYVRNDWLTLAPPPPPGTVAGTVLDGSVKPWDRDHLQPWLHLVTDNSLVVLNRGAHWAPVADVVANLSTAFAAVRARAPRAGVVFRNTPQGHDLAILDGSRAARPLAARQDTSALPAAWHYEDFGAMNARVEELVKADARATAVVWVDVETSTSLRADHHRDALHYCIPGPV